MFQIHEPGPPGGPVSAPEVQHEVRGPGVCDITASPARPRQAETAELTRRR